MATLERNLRNRAWLVARLRAEVIGPDPSGEATTIVESSSFTWENFRKPKRQPDGEEILWQDAPMKRYGAGVLFPNGVTEIRQFAEEAITEADRALEVDSSPVAPTDEQAERRIQEAAANAGGGLDDSENDDVTLANSYRPSAMGLSFLADLSVELTGIRIEIGSFDRAGSGAAVPMGTYRPVKVNVGDGKAPNRLVWLRRPLLVEGGLPIIEISSEQLLGARAPIREWVKLCEQKLEVVIVSREVRGRNDSGRRLITVCLVNKQIRDEGRIDERCYFQSGIRVLGRSSDRWIVPYPEVVPVERKPGDEEEVLRLLYRDRATFGIGHGCSADWEGGRPRLVGSIWTNCLPTCETESMSADLQDSEGTPLRVGMRKLAGLDPNDIGMNDLKRLVVGYETWIASLETSIENRDPPVAPSLVPTARILIDKCKAWLLRIEDGLNLLADQSVDGEHARKAFRLANHAMLISRLRGGDAVRTPVWENGQLRWSKPISDPDPSVAHVTQGFWRGFQIAFFLASIRGIVEPDHDDRTVVDLIWFPTGGGKTEAYLGLTAFTIFYNRLAGRRSSGADVLMRYTLRLLTAQQFQRAALLFCAMEHLRRKDDQLCAGEPFRLGMWVGGATTPNTRADARHALTQLQKNPDSENPFVLLKCPWCNAQFGPSEERAGSGRGGRGRARGGISVYGYHRALPNGGGGQTVIYRCEDTTCEFGADPARPGNPALPIVVIDEDIFESPPNLIIGTVDKFAMLAWKPETRSIFGIGADGNHSGIPPTLIIQDELHLISGPLGSMVGAYETVIEELCTADIRGRYYVPKIVASTATISRAENQVRSLYAREQVMLFPPSGLEAGDSFFAVEARDSTGNLKPGRLYAGVLAPGHGSLQTTEARVFATLLQYPAVMEVENGDESERDPWWTLLLFFNSLRELGGAATLLVADARDYLRVILDRHGYPYSSIRKLISWEELTSRIRSDKIPEVIQKLERNYPSAGRGDVLEACLASNIIEVGVDIQRLALMAIVGQPKTTSQYIQVSSRVGRTESCPGLAVIAYSQSKPRDRSHYERFRSYHHRLYAQVEPTSVTPFSPPAVDRALHGIIVAACRQLSPLTDAQNPRPFPLRSGSALRKRIEEMIDRRTAIVDSSESGNVRQRMLERLAEWEAWSPARYGGFGAPLPDAPLIHPAGSTQPVEWRGHSWPTLSSLRNVDASCEAEVTSHYNEPMHHAPQ